MSVEQCGDAGAFSLSQGEVAELLWRDYLPAPMLNLNHEPGAPAVLVRPLMRTLGLEPSNGNIAEIATPSRDIMLINALANRLHLRLVRWPAKEAVRSDDLFSQAHRTER